MNFPKKHSEVTPGPEEIELTLKIKKVYWKLFPWTLFNFFSGILIGYFTWFYYFFVILGEHIVWKREGFENILGFLLLYIAPLISILGLVSISVTVIAKLSYRRLIARHYFEERDVNNKLWNTSVIICICSAVVTLLIRLLI